MPAPYNCFLSFPPFSSFFFYSIPFCSLFSKCPPLPPPFLVPSVSVFIPSSVISPLRILSCVGWVYLPSPWPCLHLCRLSFLIGVSLCQPPPPPSPSFPLISSVLYLREETGIRQTASPSLCIGLISLRSLQLFVSSSCSCCHAVSFWRNQAVVVVHKVK